MATDIVVPPLGESVTEATVARWLKQPGEAVAVDDPLVELETDKVTLEVNAPAAGTLSEILVAKDANVSVGGVLGRIAEGGAGKAAAPRPAAKPAVVTAPAPKAPPAPAARPAPVATAKPAPQPVTASAPAVPGTGKDGRVTKGDMLGAIAAGTSSTPAETGPREERVRMTRLRRRIAERLKEAQNTAAMLTTFNEADMSVVMAVRERYRGDFEKKYGVRLGFMSFFVKACIVALKEIPAANGEIDGEDVIYKNHYDIGVAVGTEQGLVVPVLRDADRLDFAAIEKQVADLGQAAGLRPGPEHGDADRGGRDRTAEEDRHGRAVHADLVLLDIQRVSALAHQRKLLGQPLHRRDRVRRHRLQRCPQRGPRPDCLVRGIRPGQQRLADAGGVRGIAPADHRRHRDHVRCLDLVVVDDLGAVEHGHVRGLPQFRGQPGEQRVDQRAQVQHVVEAERGGQQFGAEEVGPARFRLGNEPAVLQRGQDPVQRAFRDVEAAGQLVQGQAAGCAADYRQDP